RAPPLPLLEPCLPRLHRFPTVLGAACAFGYDILRQRRDGQEEAWLDGATQTLGAAGPIAVESTALHLDALGYTDTVGRWLPAALARMPTTRLTPLSARNLAALLLKAGCMAEALPFAEVAVAREPDHPAVLATLGEVLLAVGRPDEAVGYLRASLARRDNARLRDILTRATAGQDHPDTTRDQTTQALE